MSTGIDTMTGGAHAAAPQRAHTDRARPGRLRVGLSRIGYEVLTSLGRRYHRVYAGA